MSAHGAGEKGHFDWALLHARVAQLRDALDRDATSELEQQAILERRARRLSEPRRSAASAGESRLCLRLGSVAVEVPLAAVSRLENSLRIRPVPGMPTSCRGLALVGERLVMVYELAALLGVEAESSASTGVIAVLSGERPLALRADALLGASAEAGLARIPFDLERLLTHPDLQEEA
jgi:hypothetical protein